MQVKVRSKKKLAPGLSITQAIPGLYSQYKVRLKSMNRYLTALLSPVALCKSNLKSVTE